VPDFAQPIVYVVLIWWFSTGAILYLDGLHSRTFRWTVIGASGVMAVSVAAVLATRSDTTPFGAYAAFTASLMIWGWNEVLFLTGFVTGPVRQACPAGMRGWQHFRNASLSIIHHELLILASGICVAALTFGAQNQVAFWTFLVLWAMRLSTKLNIFLGVPNLSEEFLPDHLAYLASFFRRRPMNNIFPISVTVSTVTLVVLIMRTWSPTASDFERTGLTLVATLVGLGLVEHWFLVLPIRVSELWAWGFTSRQTEPAAKPGAPIPTGARRDTSPPPASTTGTISPVAIP
jgi:putative photosynthetic complex assembly protein 2